MPTFEELDLGSLVVRHGEARHFVDEIEDPIVREAVRFALFRAMNRFTRWKDQTDQAFMDQLPKTPFDALFFAEIAKDVFSHKERVLRTLHGEEIDDFGGD